MSTTQILGITLIVMAFIATVKVFISGFKAFKINNLELEILIIDHKIRFMYDTMTTDEVNALFIQDTKLKSKLFKLTNKN